MGKGAFSLFKAQFFINCAKLAKSKVCSEKNAVKLIVLPQIVGLALLIAFSAFLSRDSELFDVNLAALCAPLFFFFYVNYLSGPLLLSHLMAEIFFCSVVVTAVALNSGHMIGLATIPIGVMIAALYRLRVSSEQIVAILLAALPAIYCGFAAAAYGGRISGFDILFTVGMLIVCGSVLLITSSISPSNTEAHVSRSREEPQAKQDIIRTSRVLNAALFRSEEVKIWSELFEQSVLNALRRENSWRLILLFSIIYCQLLPAFQSLRKIGSDFLLYFLPLFVFQLILLKKLRDSKKESIYQVILCSLFCSAFLASLVLSSFLSFQGQNFTIIIALQIFCWLQFSWPPKTSFFWIFAILLAVLCIFYSAPHSWQIVCGLVLSIPIALKISNTNYHNLLLREASAFLAKLCAVAQKTGGMLPLAARLMMRVCNVRKGLILFPDGSICRVTQHEITQCDVNQMVSKAFVISILEERKEEGIRGMSAIDAQTRVLLHDCQGAVPKSYLYCVVPFIIEDRDIQVVIMLPVNSQVRWLGADRVVKNLRALVAIFNVYLTSARSQVVSYDAVYKYERAVAERDEEINHIVHLVNNGAQDIAIHCENARAICASQTQPLAKLVTEIEELESSLRSVSVGVSDIKLLREILAVRSFTGKDVVSISSLCKELFALAAARAAERKMHFESKVDVKETDALNVPSRYYLEAVIRALLGVSARRQIAITRMLVEVRRDEENVYFEFHDNDKILLSDTKKRILEGVAEGVDYSQNFLNAAVAFATLSHGSLTFGVPAPGYNNNIVLSLPRVEYERLAPVSGGQWALLVDDNAQVTNFYARVAEALSLRYFTAESLQQAEQLLRREGKPRLVITDIQLSNSSGLDLLRLVRQSFGAEVPVVIVSGSLDENLARDASELGANKYLKKPVGRRKLFAEIQELL